MSEPLRIYDVAIHSYRDATQADIDALVAVNRTYGRIRAEVAAAHAQAVLSATPLWNCGHHHAGRDDAIECKRRQAAAFC